MLLSRAFVSVSIVAVGLVALAGCASRPPATCLLDVQSEFDVTTEAGKAIGVSDMVHVLYRSHGEESVAWNAILDRARDLTAEGARLQRDRITAMSEGQASVATFLRVAPERAERLRTRREAVLKDVSRLVTKAPYPTSIDLQQTASR
jgi:hypothetical protein